MINLADAPSRVIECSYKDAVVKAGHLIEKSGWFPINKPICMKFQLRNFEFQQPLWVEIQTIYKDTHSYDAY